MGPGTGLGAAQLMWDEGEKAYRVWPGTVSVLPEPAWNTQSSITHPLPVFVVGEGAHGTFAPRGWKQSALADYVTTKFKHCEIEQVRLNRNQMVDTPPRRTGGPAVPVSLDDCTSLLLITGRVWQWFGAHLRVPAD